MNISATNIKLAAVIMITLFAMGCSDSSNNNPANNLPSQNPSGGAAPTADIVDTAVAAGDFTTLVTALESAGLVDALRGAGPFTVFAPTDAAFSDIPATVLNDLVTNPNKAALRDILRYHVFDGEVFAADALALSGQSIPMLNGDLLTVNDVNGAVVLNNGTPSSAMVVTADIQTTNGVIHVIDTVLDPNVGKSTIVDKLKNLGNFTTLVAALEASGLDTVLDGAGPFTLFAPDDTAFGAIPSNVINDLLADLPTLTNILTYHAFGGEVYAVDAIAQDGNAVTMINGSDLALDLVGGALILNQSGNSPATVVDTDYIGTNGVIHIIDTVLDPTDAP